MLDRGPDAIARLLRRDLLRVYPQLEGVKVDYAWGGLMSYARHKMPQIGRDADGVWHAIAFGGHGMAPTTVAGEVLAATLAEGRPVPEGFNAFATRTFAGGPRCRAAHVHRVLARDARVLPPLSGGHGGRNRPAD